MKVLKICVGDWENASRDKRELSTVRELGHEVEVVAKGERSGVVDDVAGFKVTRLSSRPLGEKIPVSLNRGLSMLTWASYVRKRDDVDVISGHDYLALTIGYLSNIGKKKKSMLVYDSHEFELGRNAKRGKLAYWCVCHLERFLMKRCAFSIMVNDAIADEVQQIHRLKERPVVVRSTPSYWKLEEQRTVQTRRELLSQLGASEDAFLVMYHGAIAPGRGIEQMLCAIKNVPCAVSVILGNGDAGYIEKLGDLCKEQNISDRVLFHSAVPIEVLKNYVSAADVGVMTVLGRAKSYYYMLPNKFFENIQSLTPVIVSDFPSIGAIVDQYEIGLKVDPESPEAIAAAIRRMREDQAFYAACKENLKQAKEELCWEKEKLVLQEAYRRILI